ncbi:MAG: hypothetical protein N3D11_03495 [Candidatus Sumerlaeia bacterium]|nr:hypothetical protein [Candidatus Sumerlaeia bacterium]
MAKIHPKDILDRAHWSAHQIAKFVESRLHRVIERAAQHVPFYEKRFHSHGIKLRDIRQLRDISILPFTTRADLQREADALLARDVVRESCRQRAAVAEPGAAAPHVFLSPDEYETIRLIERRIIETHGLTGRHDRVAILPQGLTPPPQTWLDSILRGRRYYIPTSETTLEHLHVISRVKPDCVAAPLWALSRISGEIRKGKALGFQPRLLLSWGEVMRASDRDALRETFGVPPTDVYSVWELGPVAAECPARDGLHVNFDLVHVEILHNGHPVNPGEPGEVVLTSLANDTMPLIRYRVGDVASWKKGPCKCGWQGPVLEGVHGRFEHSVHLPGGGYVGTRHIEHILDQFTNVLAYRLVQTDPRKVEILVVPTTMFNDRTSAMMRTKCLELFNQQIGVEIKVVDELPIVRSPRRHSVVCKIKTPLTA